MEILGPFCTTDLFLIRETTDGIFLISQDLDHVHAFRMDRLLLDAIIVINLVTLQLIAFSDQIPMYIVILGTNSIDNLIMASINNHTLVLVHTYAQTLIIDHGHSKLHFKILQGIIL